MSDQDLGERRSRLLDGIELLLWLALMGLGSLVVLVVLEEGEERPKGALVRSAPEDLIEAEALQEVARKGEFQFWLQPTTSFEGGLWSKDGHMVALGAQRGDWIELALPGLPTGLYQLELFLTRASDYGIVTFELNGAALGSPLDLWSERFVVPSDAVDLGRVSLREGRNTLRITVIDANAASQAPRYQFAIDGLSLRAVTDQRDTP